MSTAPDLVALLQVAFAEEIDRVSRVEFNSNVICRHFYGKLRENFERKLAAIPAAKVEGGEPITELVALALDKCREIEGAIFSPRVADLREYLIQIRDSLSLPVVGEPTAAQVHAAQEDYNAFPCPMGGSVGRGVSFEQMQAAIRAGLALRPVAEGDALDAARWRRLVNASEMAFPVATIADDPENDHTMIYGRKRLEDFIDGLDEISDSYPLKSQGASAS